MPTLSRRTFLAATSGALAATALAAEPLAPAKRPKVAAVFTAWAHRWHAHVILENFLEPYLFNGKLTDPGVDVVSFYADQFPEGDMARPVAKQYGIPLFDTVAGALTLGGKKLAVDAILLIGEHGDYPLNEHGIKQYPRKELFDQCAAVVRKAGHGVPIFVDKHLSYRWDWAKEMYDTARALDMPLLAGSSVPLAQRIPPLEVDGRTKIEQAISIHGGPFEMYDFHAFEVLQAMVEARPGGETGVESIQVLRGDALLDSAKRGLWDPRLATAALATHFDSEQPPLETLLTQQTLEDDPPHGILVRYADGLVGVILAVKIPGNAFLYAHRLAGGKIHAMRHYGGPWDNRNLFKALSHAIQTHFRNRRPPYPTERTLLTTGLTAAAVDSLAAGDKEINTPHLNIHYRAGDWSAMRETGASWKILTEGTPEPEGITRGGHGSKKAQ